MKKKLFVLITMLVGVFFNVTAAEFSTQEKRVAILPFSVKGNFDALYAEVAQDNFTTELIKGGAYRVVERSQLDKAMKELKFQSGNDFDETSAMEVGKLAGAEIVQNPKSESEWGNLMKVGRGPGAVSGEASPSTADKL